MNGCDDLAAAAGRMNSRLPTFGASCCWLAQEGKQHLSGQATAAIAEGMGLYWRLAY